MNGGKDVKIGDDKRQISIVPNDEVVLYNISNGEILTDEFGDPVVTAVDTFFLPDATQERSSSVVFSSRYGSYDRIQEISIATTEATYSSTNNNNVGIVTIGGPYSLEVGDIVVGPSIPEATFISRVGIGSIYISNFTTNSTPKTENISIKRKSIIKAKSDPVWKIAEQFKESSEVSTTLLGIDRSEVQLSLFSNVSSYGLDPDDFEFYSFGGGGDSFASWEVRLNQIYGNRYSAKITEETQESAIQLAAFPTPYSFPYGPKFERLGWYNSILFNNYIRFIELGNNLDEYFNNGTGSSYPSDWKRKFLPAEIASVIQGDVDYTAGIDQSFAFIDTWTDTWRDIKDGILKDPTTGTTFGFSEVNQILNFNYDSTNTRPGYADNQRRYAYLQSRKVFRYQPGRISGFTFGLRSSVEPTNGIILEWGISNPTDQYVFRVEAGQFSIVRRSTIPLERSVLERNGLTLEDQTRIPSGNPFDSTLYWTVNIPRDNFNGDPLNSNGPSGYLINLERVTMYKIEFGWYGAIGARFYAYIPTSNGDARWVVIHTLVIENSLESPCLRDSYFRFKYSLDVQNTGDVRTPQYLYKYGASYYIDGGDEGTSQVYSVSSKEKSISSSEIKSLIGIAPKNAILNREGIEIENKKLIIPTELNISTDSLTEVKVVTCSACPGFGHVYTPGIATTENGRYIDIEFSDANTIAAINDSYFIENDIGAKIISPSIYNAYITNLSDPVGTSGSYLSASVKGFVFGNTLVNRDIGGSLVYDRVAGISTNIRIGIPYPYPVRLSNYDSYAASDFPLTGSKIEIQFVNPSTGDNYAHFADFLIGITDKKPDVSLPNTLNGFIIPGVGTTTILPNSEILFGEHSHNYSPINEDGVEVGEAGPTRMGIDSRIPSLQSPAGGVCSKLTLEVLSPLNIDNINERNYLPDSESTTPDPEGRRWIEIQGAFPNIDYDGGQIAILGPSGSIIPTGSRFVGVTSSYVGTGGSTFSYIQISQTLGSIGPNFTILVRPIQATGNGIVNSTILYNYNPFPLYLVAKLKDRSTINNISVKETIGNFQRTISPKWYTYANTSITNANGNADITGAPPTNFQEISRSSSVLIDTQNEQLLRPYTVRDTFYISANSTSSIDMKKVFNPDRTVITPDNNNIEATFVVAKKIDSGVSGTVEASLNFKEQ